MKIISDGLFFYTKVSDNLTHEIIAYFNNNQGDRVTNIAGKAIARNGFVRFPLACYPKWTAILQNYCMEKKIELIWTDQIDSKGDGLEKLVKLFSEDDIESGSTGITCLDKYLGLVK